MYVPYMKGYGAAARLDSLCRAVTHQWLAADICANSIFGKASWAFAYLKS